MNKRKILILTGFMFCSVSAFSQAMIANTIDNVLGRISPSITVINPPAMGYPGTVGINGENPKSAVITPEPAETEASEGGAPPSTAALAGKEKKEPVSQVQNIGLMETMQSGNTRQHIPTGIEQYNTTTLDYYNEWGKNNEREKLLKLR